MGEVTDAPPGPGGLPVVGNFPAFLRDPLAFYERLSTYDSDVVAYSVLGRRGYLVTDPDLIQEVLVRDADSYVRGRLVREAFEPLVGAGLFVVQDDQWLTQRTLMQPVFTLDRLESYGETMVAYAARTGETWRDGEVRAIEADMRQLTLEILATTLFGLDIRDRTTAIGEMATAAIERFDLSSLAAWLPLWVPTPRNRRFRAALAEGRALVDELVAEHEPAGPDADLLSVLRSAETADGRGFTDAELRDNLLTFLFAGHETTALALTYTWYLLARHPEKARRLRAELDGVLGGHQPTVADLSELVYTEWVIKEAMRLYPPAPTMFREPLTDVELGGYPIPEGAFLSMPPYVVQRDERWYADPETFRPERWAPSRVADRPEYAYFPFGGGPRHCIGMRFALLEAQLVLATLAQDWTVAPELDELDLSMAITLQPRDAVELCVEQR